MIEFYELRDIDCPDFQAAIEIYEAAFPPSELIAIDVFSKRVDRGDYQLWVCQQDNRVAFMAILCQPIVDRFVLLGYIATHPDYRNKGIGSDFFETILPKLQQQSQSLLLEVENPNDGDDRALRQRRVNFYRRLGAKTLKNVRYILPALSGGEPTEMILMVAPAREGDRISGEEVRQLITELYTIFYDCQPDDPLLQQSLHGIGEWVECV
jgi:ribosomal protein S18 acetylase RimI-like enzyme